MRSLSLLSLAVAAGCAPSVMPGAGAADAAPAPDAAAPAPDAARRPDAAVPPAEMYVHTADQLFVIDDREFALTLVGPFGLDGSESGMTDIAVTPDGTLYGITETRLFTIDRATGAATYVADVPGVSNVGLTFLPDGALLATDAAGGVRRVDPATGAVTEIGSFGGGYATAGDLVAVADGTMFAVSDEGPNGDEHDNNVLLTVDTATGAATPVGPIGFGGVFGCAVANNKVYAFTRAGEVIEIDPATGAGTLRRAYPGTSFWGAGVTPLVVIE
ncbi:MAG: hypothetical protein D6689_20975 [Deltaproteobacteria bacterium]|nr:MAG: hypothetical protein D6689_20975 [Deltaproteobacteria bacterium]